MEFEPQSLGFEATKHMCNRMRKENCRKRLYSMGIRYSCQRVKNESVFYFNKTFCKQSSIRKVLLK